jgi:hypothetical protein
MSEFYMQLNTHNSENVEQAATQAAAQAAVESSSRRHQ